MVEKRGRGANTETTTGERRITPRHQRATDRLTTQERNRRTQVALDAAREQKLFQQIKQEQGEEGERESEALDMILILSLLP